MTDTVDAVRYVEAPRPYDGPGPALFLAGGISGCPDWQADAVALLRDTPGLTVLNPRRAVFGESAAVEQITWEFAHLRRADVVLFWFAAGGSVQPITLFELGVHVTRDVALAVGADPGYPRRLDVEVQLGLARPGLPVFPTLAETVAHAKATLGETVAHAEVTLAETAPRAKATLGETVARAAPEAPSGVHPG